MDYEKKYKDALGWMRDMYPCLTDSLREDAEHYFPELAESEDERIRKWLIDLVKRESGFNGTFPSQGQVLAWLEKQKEPKDPFDDEQFKRGYDAGKYDGYQEGYKKGMESTSYHFPVMPTPSSGFGCDGIHCTNPHYDCINCPRKDSSAGRLSTLGTGSISLSTNDSSNSFELKATNKSLEQSIMEACKPVEDVGKYLDEQLQRFKKEQKPAENGDRFVKAAEEYASKVDCGEYGVAVTEAFIAGALYEKNQSAEWSEEDEDKLNRIYRILPQCVDCRPRIIGDKECIELQDFLKSLRPSWKPSEEQIPKWRKMPIGYEIRPANVCTIAVDLLDVNGKCCGQIGRTVLQNGDEYLFLDDLEKLPKEN